MSRSSLIKRIERLEARIPRTPDAKMRARYKQLHDIADRGYWAREELSDAEQTEYSDLRMRLCLHLPPAKTPEEHAARARWFELFKKWGPKGLTEAEQVEFDELNPRYHRWARSHKEFKEAWEKVRIKEEERFKAEWSEKQRRRRAATESSANGQPSATHDAGVTRPQEAAPLRQSVQQRKTPVTPPRVEKEEGEYGCDTIDCDYDPNSYNF